MASSKTGKQTKACLMFLEIEIFRNAKSAKMHLNQWHDEETEFHQMGK